jgi:hypothetical protein
MRPIYGFRHSISLRVRPQCPDYPPFLLLTLVIEIILGSAWTHNRYPAAFAAEFRNGNRVRGAEIRGFNHMGNETLCTIAKQPLSEYPEVPAWHRQHMLWKPRFVMRPNDTAHERSSSIFTIRNYTIRIVPFACVYTLKENPEF